MKLYAILLTASSGLLFEFQGAISRHLSASLDAIFIAAAINILVFIIFATVTGIRKKALPKTAHIRSYGLRGSLWFLAFCFYISSLSLIPLADVAALSLSSGLFTAMLGAIVLRETFSHKDIIAITVGFLGTLIIIKPGSALFHYGSILVIISAALWAWNNLIAKQLTKHDDVTTINFYTWSVITLFTLPMAFIYWQSIDLQQLFLLTLAAISLASFMMIVTKAFALADLVTLAPFWFTRPIFAAIFGFIFFAQNPEIWTFIGAAIIIYSAIYITRHHRKIARL